MKHLVLAPMKIRTIALEVEPVLLGHVVVVNEGVVDGILIFLLVFILGAELTDGRRGLHTPVF